MKRATRKGTRSRPRKQTVERKNTLPLSVTTRDGKTTVRQYAGRRFVRFGEVRGKTLARLELFTSEKDSHSLSLYFRDRTVLHLDIAPGFTVNAEYYRPGGLGDPEVLKRWPEICNE
jgi:hypothetical protein